MQDGGDGARPPDAIQHGGERVDDDRLVHGAQSAEAARRRQGAGEDGRQRGLVELDDDLGPRDEPADLADVLRKPLGERPGEIARRPGVHHRPLEPGQVKTGREGPRARALQLERAGVALGHLGEHVQVLPQPGLGPAEVAPGPVDQAPAHRLQVDGQVDEQGRGSADHVRSGPPARQLGQVGHVGFGELSERRAYRLDDVHPGPGTDPAGTAGHALEHGTRA